MKKIDFKTRAQWGYFKSALIGLAIGILIAPGISDLIRGYETADAEGGRRSVREQLWEFASSVMEHFTVGDRVKIIINGEVAALTGSVEEGEAAYKAARLAYNADGVKPLWVEAEYELMDKENEADQALLKEMKLLKDQELADAVLERLEQCGDDSKKLAYTMRIDDYTVTVEHFEDLVSVLEDAQSVYDMDDEFQVGLKQPESRNSTMYEVEVQKKSNEELKAQTNNKDGNGNSDSEYDIENAEGENDTEGEGDTNREDGAADDEGTDSADKSAEVLAAEESLGADDGIKYVGFTDGIQVMETYVDASVIKDRDTAYSEITKPIDEEEIYVVEPGDYLGLIAEKVGMTQEAIKELNPQIESDDDIYYDDRLKIIVPTAPVQILVEKQETYTESYYADVVYEDDGSMYIGETAVLQEGSPGTHTVTDLVTYKGDMESSRSRLDEVVEVAAVAEVVLRGTKSKPTYMFPVTNWTVTSNFGYRWGRLHAGTDVGVPIGTTVRASRGGQVITAGWVGGYGNCVIIDHGDGVCTRYGHLSQVLVSVGQYVDQGDQIALSGNTGRSTGPHLHFEIRINGEAVDPLPYLYQ